MTDTPTPPDGWYPDPAGGGGLRRWNGASWTDEVRAVDGSTPVPSEDAPVDATAGDEPRDSGDAPVAATDAPVGREETTAPAADAPAH
ncbi:hypothetical protein HR12_21055, partial [Microbacterium sp. SUBG005]